ncbi:MAG TPA: hypothetical protein VGI26_07320 [Solirubrobacteraceae bacterium]
MARHTRAAITALLTVCVLVALCCAAAGLAGAAVRRTVTSPTPSYSATLEQCVTSTVQLERSATFTAQMVATPATEKMAVRFELEQRMRGELDFHTVVAPGLGTWQRSEPGVKIYKYVKQVTNLAAPAAYRAVVRFRWLGEKGRVLKRAELHTQRCAQPTLSAQVRQAPAS